MTVKWTGSKKWVKPAFKEMDECFEPFAGSASISLTWANKVYLNDLCTPLTEMYKAMKVNKVGLIDDAEDIFNSIKNAADSKAKFYEVRNQFNVNGGTHPAEFLAILYSGFNGLWRSGPNGCNVPYGGPRKFPTKYLLETPVDKIVSITNKTWQELTPPNETCVVYADPPYASTFTGFTAKGWSLSENVELFDSLSKLPNPVIISCLKTDENMKLLDERNFDYVSLTKLYSNGRSGSIKKEEILAFNDEGQRYIKFRALKTS